MTLVIRADQVKVFEQTAWRQFEDEMVHRIFPLKAAYVGEAGLKAL